MPIYELLIGVIHNHGLRGVVIDHLVRKFVELKSLGVVGYCQCVKVFRCKRLFPNLEVAEQQGCNHAKAGVRIVREHTKFGAHSIHIVFMWGQGFHAGQFA